MTKSILFYQGDRPIYEDEDDNDYFELQYAEFLREEEEKKSHYYWFYFELFPLSWWHSEAVKQTHSFIKLMNKKCPLEEA